MKHIALFALAAPAALLAQTPATPTLIAKADELQKATATEVNRLIGAFQFEEAVAKAAAFAATPAFPFPSIDVATLEANPAAANEHGAKAQEALAANATLLNGFVSHANALRAAGQWEKAAEALRAGATRAEQNLVAFRASVAPIAGLWQKLENDGKAFIAANEGRIKNAETALMTEKSRLEKAWEDYKTKKVKLTKKEFDKLDAETKAFDPMAKAFDADNQKLAFHKGNIGRMDAVKGALQNMEKVGDVASTLRKNADTVQSEIERQKKEIDEFNAKQAEKKKTKKTPAPVVEGAKLWVNAVLGDQNNLNNAGTPAKQAAFLNRLLVLDAGNEAATKALTNIKAGREPYFVEPKAKGAKGKAKK